MESRWKLDEWSISNIYRNPTEEIGKILPQVQEMQSDILSVFLSKGIDFGADLEDARYFAECKLI